jgi:hypothetical protein
LVKFQNLIEYLPIGKITDDRKISFHQPESQELTSLIHTF